MSNVAKKVVEEAFERAFDGKKSVVLATDTEGSILIKVIPYNEDTEEQISNTVDVFRGITDDPQYDKETMGAMIIDPMLGVVMTSGILSSIRSGISELFNLLGDVVENGDSIEDDFEDFNRELCNMLKDIADENNRKETDCTNVKVEVNIK